MLLEHVGQPAPPPTEDVPNAPPPGEDFPGPDYTQVPNAPPPGPEEPERYPLESLPLPGSMPPTRRGKYEYRPDEYRLEEAIFRQGGHRDEPFWAVCESVGFPPTDSGLEECDRWFGGDYRLGQERRPFGEKLQDELADAFQKLRGWRTRGGGQLPGTRMDFRERLPRRETTPYGEPIPTPFPTEIPRGPTEWERIFENRMREWERRDARKREEARRRTVDKLLRRRARERIDEFPIEIPVPVITQPEPLPLPEPQPVEIPKPWPQTTTSPTTLPPSPSSTPTTPPPRPSSPPRSPAPSRVQMPGVMRVASQIGTTLLLSRLLRRPFDRILQPIGDPIVPELPSLSISPPTTLPVADLTPLEARVPDFAPAMFREPTRTKRCHCEKCEKPKKRRKRTCLARGNLQWVSGPKKGKPAGRRCVTFL